MIKEQQHSLNTSNSNAQCQGSQTFSLSEEELSRNTLLPTGMEGMGCLLHSIVLVRGTPGWGLGGKPVPASSEARCGLPARALPIPSDPQGTI